MGPIHNRIAAALAFDQGLIRRQARRSLEAIEWPLGHQLEALLPEKIERRFNAQAG